MVNYRHGFSTDNFEESFPFNDIRSYASMKTIIAAIFHSFSVLENVLIGKIVFKTKGCMYVLYRELFIIRKIILPILPWKMFYFSICSTIKYTYVLIFLKNSLPLPSNTKFYNNFPLGYIRDHFLKRSTLTCYL